MTFHPVLFTTDCRGYSRDDSHWFLRERSVHEEIQFNAVQCSSPMIDGKVRIPYVNLSNLPL